MPERYTAMLTIIFLRVKEHYVYLERTSNWSGQGEGNMHT